MELTYVGLSHSFTTSIRTTIDYPIITTIDYPIITTIDYPIITSIDRTMSHIHIWRTILNL